MIRVLVVDDSPLMQRILRDVLSRDPEILVTACLGSGEEALAFLGKQPVDVITMDISMPGMDGFTATRKIMESPHPTPVIIISSQWEPREVEKTFRAMDAGAVAILPKPEKDLFEKDEQLFPIFRIVKSAALTKVKRLRPRLDPLQKKDPREKAAPSSGTFSEPSEDTLKKRFPNIKSVVVGASTGGPQALTEFLSHLPGTFSCPLLVVQHISKGFDSGLAEWLGKNSPLAVKLAEEREIPRGGTVYLAPSGVHLGMNPEGALIFSKDPPEHGVRPAASWLFRTAAKIYGGDLGAVLFSGMGRDGALELRYLRDLGALTFAQSRETSVVWGMPGEAVRLNAPEYVGSPAFIARILGKLLR